MTRWMMCFLQATKFMMMLCRASHAAVNGRSGGENEEAVRKYEMEVHSNVRAALERLEAVSGVQ